MNLLLRSILHTSIEEIEGFIVRALVTGAGGFVGKELTRHLLSHGLAVTAMVRNPKQKHDLESLGADVVIADLNNPDSLDRAVDGADRVFHIAALFRQAGLPASEFHRVNVEGTKNLLESSIKAGVENFVHCSTVGVLGHIENPPADESTPYNPGDPYQESKAVGEQLFLQYVREGKIKGSVIRPAMIYGPDDVRTLKLFKKIAQRRFFYVGPGTSLVHFVDVRDLAQSFRLASERPDVNGEIFIVGGETSLPLVELVTIISSLIGVPEPWLHLPVKPMQNLGSLCEAICTPLRINPPIFRRRVDFFTKDRNFDCSKARDILGYKPAKTLVEELIDIIASYVAGGKIERSQIKKPSAILRSLDGHIHSWDEDAKRDYGWSQDQAVGEISHKLLATRFPDKLSEINHQLKTKGFWQGALIHKNRDGAEVQSMSKWKLLKQKSNSDPMVLELNRIVASESKYRSLTPFVQASLSAAASI